MIPLRNPRLFSASMLLSKRICFKYPTAESSDEELEIRQKNFNKAKELIGAAGLCRDNIIWYLGDPPLEKNVSLTVVTLDTVTYVYSRIGIPDTMVFILNNSGKTISRVL